MAEVSGHISEHVNVINVFHAVISILYTLSNIHPKTEILLKVRNFPIVKTYLW